MLYPLLFGFSLVMGFELRYLIYLLILNNLYLDIEYRILVDVLIKLEFQFYHNIHDEVV
jgi:hypothetical protein